MKKFFIIPFMAVALFSCSSNKNSSEATEADETIAEATLTPVETTWRLQDFPGETEMVVIEPGTDYMLSFNSADGTFGMTTDCNSIGGEYKINGDSIAFTNLLSTQMACPDEMVENAMKTILPMVTTYAMRNDSTLELRADMRTMATFTAVK